MPAISVGSVEVDVVPNVKGIYAHLKEELETAGAKAGKDAGEAAGKAFGPAMQSQVSGVGLSIGEQIGEQIANRIKDALKDAIKAGITQGGQTSKASATRQGDTNGGAFARALRARLEAAFRSMPKLDVRLSDTGVDADLARLRARLETLAGKTVGIDIDAATARAQAEDIEQRLQRIGAAHPNVAVRADTAAAIAQLRLLREQIDEVSADPLRIRVETDGQLGTKLRAAVQQAEASLPNVNIGADTSPAQVEIARLRAQLTALRDARIGVDIDAATALARIGQIQARLARLSSQDADVAVRVDAGAASAQLVAFQAAVNRLDGQSVNVDTKAATSGMRLLVASAVLFGPAILPVLPVVAAGLGAVAAAAVAAGVGIGAIGLVAIPAFKGIASVLQAQKAAQDAATQATYQGAQANSQGAQRALQMESAQQSLATAERNGARQIAQAQQAVKQAKQSAADAIAQAAVRNEQAARRVQDAERSLADAQRDAKRAQTDLSDARRQAARELQDLNSQLAGAQLDQRQAVLDLQDAERELRAVQEKGSAATAGELQRAQLNYDRAKLALSDQKTETKRLGEETKAANKAGVEGSDTFKSAQERLAEAQRNVADQAQAVKDAQQEAARTQLETARQVADAQQRVGEATANVAVAQQSAADAVASAQRQIESASLSAAGGVDQAAIAQAKYEAELAKLTPAARDTMDAYLGLRDAFSAWSKSLQPSVMPIFTRALNAMGRALPGLTPFVTAAADAVQTLMDRASADLKSPFWRGFKDDLEGSVKPAVIGLGVAFGNVFKGMAGIIGAFLPHMDSISERMQSVTGRFADWGASLKGSPEFEKFLAYSAQMAPRISEALGALVGAVISVASALAPITTLVLAAITQVSDAISWVADNAPWVIQGIYGIVLAMSAWRLTMLLWRGATLLATGAMKLFNLVSLAGPWGWIALAIAGVVTAIYLLYTKCEWFREAVQVVWDGLKAGGQAVADWFSGPFVRFFTDTIPGAFQATLDWVTANWPYIIGALGGPVGVGVAYAIQHWDDLKAGLSSGWSWIKKWVLYPIRDFFTDTIPGWATDLKDAIVGAFSDAAEGAKKGFGKLRGYAKAPVQYVVDIVYNDGIRGVWNMIAGAFGAPKLDRFVFAKGGIMPGYTPGRDVHKFVSPTGGALELSGGESIFRPEFTRAVGSGFVNTMNSIASSRGASGVKAALAPVFGGNPVTPVDRSLRYAGGGTFPVQSFKDGGVFGWIGGAANKLAGAGSAAWNKIKEGASWLGDTLEASARAGIKNVVDPLLKKFPGMDTGIGRMIRNIPNKIIDALFSFSKDSDKKGAGGIGGPRIQAGLKWAKTQNGKAYQWGGNGNPSWDCSGFMSAIESVIRGQKPHRRWATGAFSGRTAPPGWVYHGDSAFKIGITNAGVGHTAGTLGKTNVESRGGAGVIVGSRARGYKDSLFNSWYGFKPGSYDSGGYLQPGLNLAYNGTGRPEPVFTTSQANALMSMAKQQVATGLQPGDQLALRVGDHEFTAYIDGRADSRVSAGNQQLIQTLNAS